MYGLNIDPANPQGNPTAAELRDLGVQMVRLVFKDQGGGSQPSLNQVRFYTSKIQEYSNAGIDSLVILNYETYPGKPSSSASDAEWGTYTNNFIHRVGQLAQILNSWRPTFQIWNEPDLPPHPGYDPTLREAVYGRLLRRAYDTIKTVNPTLTVVGAGLASGDANWWARVIQSQSGQVTVDALAVHPYGQRPEPSWPNPAWGFGYVGDLINRYAQIRQELLWITEVGVSNLTREGQAEYLRRFYRAITSQFAARVKWVHWFCYSDGMVSPFGLLDTSRQRKPAYFAYREITPDTPLPDRPAYAVQYVSHNTPISAVAGQTNAVTLTVRNTSYRTWVAGGQHRFRLGYHWYTTDGQDLSPSLWSDFRTALPFDVQPNQSVTLNANLSIPRVAGTYEVRWDMVEEMVTWFAWQGVATLNVRVTVTSVTEPPPQQWRVSASHNNNQTGTEGLLRAIDNNPYTRWATQTPQRPGMWFQIDLGEARPISQIQLDNALSPRDYPRGYIVRISTDGQNWTVVAFNQANTQPVNVVFSSRPARFVQIEQTASDPTAWWAIHEVEISNQVTLSASSSHNNVLVGADNLRQALDGQAATRWSSRALQVPGMWFEIDLNQVQLVSGLTLSNSRSPSDYPRGYVVRVSMDRSQWTEVARNPQNNGPLNLTFNPRCARYIRVEQTGRSDQYWWSIHELFVSAEALEPGGGSVSAAASHNNVLTGPDNLLLALNASASDRWSSRASQTPGMWFEINLGKIRPVNGLTLDNAASPNDYPRGYVIRVSVDRNSWEEVARSDPNNQAVNVNFSPRCARFVRVELTRSSNQVWWSIHRVGLRFSEG